MLHLEARPIAAHCRAHQMCHSNTWTVGRYSTFWFIRSECRSYYNFRVTFSGLLWFECVCTMYMIQQNGIHSTSKCNYICIAHVFTQQMRVGECLWYTLKSSQYPEPKADISCCRCHVCDPVWFKFSPTSSCIEIRNPRSNAHMVNAALLFTRYSMEWEIEVSKRLTWFPFECCAACKTSQSTHFI